MRLKCLFSPIFFILGRLKSLSPTKKLLVGIFLGVVVGVVFGEDAGRVKFLGDIFMRMIKMTVVPLIFVSVAQVFSTIGDFARMGRIAVKCISIYLITTFITASFGIFVSVMFKPGVGVPFDLTGVTANLPDTIPETVSIMNVLVTMFPENVFESFVKADILQILVFAMLFGVAINSLSNKVHDVSTLLDSLSQIVFKLVEMVISVTPIGIFGIIAHLVGTQELASLKSLIKLAALVYACGLFTIFIVYGLLIAATGLNPFQFFKKIFPVQYFTFLTSSSAAAVPLTKIVSEKKLGVSESTASLTVPLGAAFNMNGTSLHLGMTSVFLAQVYGVDLSMQHYVKIILLSILLTIGGAGIPSASLLMMPMILTGIGVPAEMIAIYIGIDRFLDMMRSAVNVTGDVLAGVLVDKTEGTFDHDMYKRDIDFDLFQDEEVKKGVQDSKVEMFS